MQRLIERFGGRRKAVTPWLVDNVRLYSIGDIHGRADLLFDLLQRIRADAKGFAGSSVAVFLGDYVDRGPDSKAVIDCLIEDPLPGFETIFLRGNHEQSLLDFLEHPSVGERWLTFGGQATVSSYGVLIDRLPRRPEDFMQISRQLGEALPDRHCHFFRETQLCYESGSYFFCHAGVRPGVSMQKQSAEDLLWIREEFTESRRTHERIVVHGHSISESVQMLPNRIGIDTGAYDSGVLTCLVLENGDMRLIQT